MVNVKPVQLGKNTRMSFSHINEVLDMPNLIEIQKNSYDWFLKEGLCGSPARHCTPSQQGNGRDQGI